MRSATANFLALNDDVVKNPVWIMIITGLPDNRGKFASGDFADIDADYKKHLINMRLNFNTLDLLEPHADASEYTITMLDKDLSFTNVIKDYNLIGVTITIKIGFAELVEADFVSLPAVTIENIKLNPDYLSWEILAKDEFFRIKQNIFSGLPRTYLNGSIATGVATITVDSTTGFVDPTTLPAAIRAGLLIDRELKLYTGISGSNFTGVNTQAGTGDVPHDDNAVVTQTLMFLCDELIAMLYILTTTRDGTNGFYDLGIPNFGLGIPYASIMVENIERISYRNGRATQPDAAQAFVIALKDKNLSWIEKTFLAPRGCYFFVNNGKIDVGEHDYIWYNENFTSQKDFANTEIVELNFDILEPINTIRTQQYRNPITEQFNEVVEVQLDDSVSEYIENSKPFEYTINDIQFIPSIDVRWLFWNRKIFDLYGDSPAKLNFQTLMSGWLVEPGDDVRITYDYVPDLIAGTRGWTNRKVRVLGQSIDFDGECTFTGISWQILDRVANLTNGIYTLNEVAQVDIDDDALAYSANVNEVPEVTEAADAYYDNSISAYEADRITFFIKIVEPGTGSGEQIVGFRVSAVTSTGGLLGQNRYFNVRYDAAGSATRNIEISMQRDTYTSTIDHVKAEWYYRSSAVANDQPTITLTKIWFIKHERDMTLLSP